jgi:hypothetical protein
MNCPVDLKNCWSAEPYDDKPPSHEVTVQQARDSFS